ncbi:hypothetical protein CMI37_07290 [Candidatus Pacearchaeota archaeon]|nr:hypothetical protein [Candidatus Pacearchaeota archaeon]
MATDTQVTTFSDLRTDFLFRLREATGVTDTNTAADRFLNIALHDIHVSPANSVPWAERRAYLNTHADYTTGTVAIDISTSRTAVTGTSTEWDTAVDTMGFNNAQVGGKMRFNGETDVYEVSAVGSDTSITLSHRYVGSADLSGDTYVYFEDEYALASDFFRMVDARSFSREWNIPLIGRQEFRRLYPNNYIVGKPRVATLIQLAFSGDTTPRHRVVLHQPPDDIYIIPYDYITSNLATSTSGTEQTQMTADADEPILPLRYRHVLSYGALYHWYRDRKDDSNRAQLAKAEYIDLMRRITAEVGAGAVADRPRFQPRSYFNRRLSTRRGSPRFSTNSEFENFEI